MCVLASVAVALFIGTSFMVAFLTAIVVFFVVNFLSDFAERQIKKWIDKPIVTESQEK